MKDCTCNKAPATTVKSNRKKKPKKCIYNTKKVKKGRVVEEVESNCFQLKCTKSKDGAIIEPYYTEGCDCGKH